MNNMPDRLMASAEPSIRYQVWTRVLERDGEAAASLQAAIAGSERVQALLAGRNEAGEIPLHPYAKWDGAHWVLVTLAALAYPPADATLIPLREQVLAWLLGAGHTQNIKTIAGRVRRCASQEGNALFAMLALGLADERADELAGRLMAWQWPDGGWNCDRNPAAVHSSFMESLIPLRALALYARRTGSEAAADAAGRAADIFLKRRLFRRQRDGDLMKADFLRLHYPCYWHYDLLFGLKVMAEAGFVRDPRCEEALDLLVSKKLPGGGFAAEGKYYRLSDGKVGNRSAVEWGAVGRGRLNEFVTADALYVLRAAGRLEEAG